MTRYPPFATPGNASSLPAIGEFLDELPPIEDFLAADQTDSDGWSDRREDLQSITELAPDTDQDDGWAVSEWQSFDWSSLSAIARHAEGAAAQENWATTEWTSDDAVAYDSPYDSRGWSSADASAHEVADALDDIAARIRSGELAIDNLRGTPPEAAMAAALAALLRMRG